MVLDMIRRNLRKTATEVRKAFLDGILKPLSQIVDDIEKSYPIRQNRFLTNIFLSRFDDNEQQQHFGSSFNAIGLDGPLYLSSKAFNKTISLKME